MKDQLNLQSLYRGEQFHVTDSKLIPKREEIGLELTDLILGMVRTVILNATKEDTKGTQARNQFVADLLNTSPAFHEFMSGIKYFEWMSTLPTSRPLRVSPCGVQRLPPFAHGGHPINAVLCNHAERKGPLQNAESLLYPVIVPVMARQSARQSIACYIRNVPSDVRH